MRTYDAACLAGLLPFPAPDAHKYSRGMLVAVAGSDRYPGAALLAAEAAQRMGAGYVKVVTDAAAVPSMRMARPSLVVASNAAWCADELASACAEKPRACLVGPGFDPSGADTFRLTTLALGARVPVAVDGGALAVLAAEDGRALLRCRAADGFPTVITPHGGEAMRMASSLGIASDASADPANLAWSLANLLGVVVVLKGPVTYIAHGDDVLAMEAGTAALAKAGTGDVLAGMVGSLLAQGLDAIDASVLASTLHAYAGRCAADKLTDICVTAEDVVAALPDAIRLMQGAARDAYAAGEAQAACDAHTANGSCDAVDASGGPSLHGPQHAYAAVSEGNSAKET